MQHFPILRETWAISLRGLIETTWLKGDQEIPYTLNTDGLLWKRDMWRLRKIMNGRTLREWTFHHVPLFATRAADVTAELIAAAKRGVTLYEPPKGRQRQ